MDGSGWGRAMDALIWCVFMIGGLCGIALAAVVIYVVPWVWHHLRWVR